MSAACNLGEIRRKRIAVIDARIECKIADDGNPFPANTLVFMVISENGAAANRCVLNAGRMGGPSGFYRCGGFFYKNSPC